MSNSTPRAALPPLPQPFDYCYEWDGPYGKRKIGVAAPHNGRGPSRTHLLYTAEQVEQIRRETVQACAAKVSAEDDPYPGYDEWDRGYSAGIKFAVSAILALLPVKEPKE